MVSHRAHIRPVCTHTSWKDTISYIFSQFYMGKWFVTSQVGALQRKSICQLIRTDCAMGQQKPQNLKRHEINVFNWFSTKQCFVSKKNKYPNYICRCTHFKVIVAMQARDLSARYVRQVFVAELQTRSLMFRGFAKGKKGMLLMCRSK